MKKTINSQFADKPEKPKTIRAWAVLTGKGKFIMSQNHNTLFAVYLDGKNKTYLRDEGDKLFLVPCTISFTTPHKRKK